MEEPEKNVRKTALGHLKKTPENTTPQIRIKPKSFEAVSNRTMLHLSVGLSVCPLVGPISLLTVFSGDVGGPRG